MKRLKIDGVTCDEIGPELVVHVYDPLTRMKGVIVIDTLAFGRTGGGIRMLPNITTVEIARLARAMTYKFSALDLPFGGAKGGIWHHPAAPDRDKIILAYGRAIRPLIETDIYAIGPDMGTTHRDSVVINEIAGMKKYSELSQKMKDGMPLEYHFTGFGVVVAAKAASRFANLDLEGATVAIEGFGKAGIGVALYMLRAGAKLVAISTIHGGIYNPEGLKLQKLLELRKNYGDEVVLMYEDAKRIRKEELLLLPVNVLVPAARPDTINKNNADKIKAKLITPAANIPTTPEADVILFKKGIFCIPDFISNAGGVISDVTDIQSKGKATEGQIFENIEKNITSNTKEVISIALKKKVNPMTIAIRKQKKKIVEAIKKRGEFDREKTIKIVKERLGI